MVSYDWLIPILILVMAWLAYRIIVVRIRDKNMRNMKLHSNTIERMMDSENRAEDRGFDYE